MVVSFFIGLGWTAVSKGSNWKYLVGFALANQRTRAGLWTGAKWVAPYAWAGTRVLVADTITVGAAVAKTQTAAVIGSVAAGYVIGAAVGTGVVYVAEEKGIVYEGATKDVMDFYNPVSGEGHYWKQGDKPTPGYFNIPGNVAFIARTYWGRWRD